MPNDTMNFGVDLLPITTETYNLGSADKKWNIFANELHGTLATTDLSNIVSTTANKFLKDTGAWTQVDWSDLTNVPNDFTPSAHEHDYIGKNYFVAYPSDGTLNIKSGSTGYIKIQLPKKNTGTMLSFDADIYNHAANTSVRYHIAGYVKDSGTTWSGSYTAYCIAPILSAKANLTVRFLNDGTALYVTIGETTTSWSYVKVVIHNISLSHYGMTLANWKTGWTITIDNTAFNEYTTNGTVTNTSIAYKTQVNTLTPTVSGTSGYLAITPTTSDGNTLLAQDSLYVYNTVSDNTHTMTYLEIGKKNTLGGKLVLWPGNAYYGQIQADTLTANRIYTLPDAAGTIALEATTLAGYGITDASISSGTITLGSNTITPVTSVNGHSGASVTVTASDLNLGSSFKTIQTAVTDSFASTAATTTFVQSVTQDTQGIITVTKAPIDDSAYKIEIIRLTSA